VKKKHIIIVTLILGIFMTIFLGCTKNSEEVNKKVNNSKGANTFNKAGVLIGLSTATTKDDNEEGIGGKAAHTYTSYWIYSEDGKIATKKKKDALVTPVGDNFYELYNDSIELKEKNENIDSEDFYLKYSYYYNFKAINSNILGQERKGIFTEKSFQEEYLEDNGLNPFNFHVEWPIYVGNKYVSIMTDDYITGGGTFRSGFNAMQFYNIESLGDSSKRQEKTKLFDMLSKAQQNELIKIAEDFKSKNSNNNDEEFDFIKKKRVMDLDNLVLKRKRGRWTISIPVFNEFTHEGNGSWFYTVEDYVDYEGDVPEALVSHDSLCLKWEEILEAIPEAVDAVSSPNEDLLIVLTNNKLMVFNNPAEGLENAAVTIDIDGNQQIVVNQWAVGDYATKWSELFTDYFKD